MLIVALVVGLGLVGVLICYAVVWADRRQRRSSDQTSTIHALQMSLFSVAQAAERHHDAVALNGDRLAGTTTTPAASEAHARAAAVTYVSLIRDRHLKTLGTQILQSSSRLLSTSNPSEAVRLQGEVTVLQDRFRERSVEVVRDLSRRRFSRT